MREINEIDGNATNDSPGFGYHNTLMYGQYTKQLSLYARDESARLKQLRQIDGNTSDVRPIVVSNSFRFTFLGKFWRQTLSKLGEEWIFLALLGIIMAIISFVMDHGISACNNARLWLYRDLSREFPDITRYLAWVTLPVCLVLFSAGFVHFVAPQCIGSGIPEIKVILRGVTLKEYLTFRTLLAKIIGLTATLGSGLPLGKEGPFVHIASIIANLLGKLVTGFHKIYANEGRKSEILSAASAVGVAACFASPIGGVLFSIEVTSFYFAIRNYWRAFFAAVCGATIFRLLSVWFDKNNTVTALFRTNFRQDFPYDPQELIIFACLGVFCGVLGSLYVKLHRKYVEFFRSSVKLTSFLQRYRLIYPFVVTLIISSVSFPSGLGKYLAADLSTHEQVVSLFSNFTWSKEKFTVEEQDTLKHWTSNSSIFINLIAFAAYNFIFSIIATTIPIPSGMFIPVFKIGAALGRLTGELMSLTFPHGLHFSESTYRVIPGAYATVGAAALSGSVTRTISVSVIVFEMTGQISYLIPIMIAVLIANAVSSLLGPSIYDSIIIIKRLPYLPDLLPASSAAYDMYVEDFMIRDVRYVYRGISYAALKALLLDSRHIRTYPLVDTPDTMVLLGSVRRPDLITLIDKHIGRERRLQVAAQRHKQAEVHQAATTAVRRASRFRVEPAPDINSLHVAPKKSILKKTNSFTVVSSSGTGMWNASPNATPYQTVTGAESRVRLAFEAIFRKASQLQDVDDGGTVAEPLVSSQQAKKVQLPRERVIDMSPEDQRLWEVEEMAKEVDLTKCRIDPAPFQLVERTSLLKVHSLFSLIGINHAYVTATGRLVGVVRLKDLRSAIEDANAGRRPPTIEQTYPRQPEQTTAPKG